jgi:hypothetical protein
MKRVDPETSNQIHTILMLCRSRGQDPVAALNAAGFIRHEGSKHADYLRALEYLGQALKDMPIQLLKHNEVPRTPLDLKRYIIILLDNVVKEVEKQLEQATQ